MKYRTRHIWAGIAFFLLCLVQMYAFQPAGRRGKEDRKIQFASERLYHDINVSQDGDILIGNVRITHNGMHLTCDSAVVYENSNSFLAYGNVHMTQGDSISLKGDSLYYDGTQEFAQVFDNVEMRHGKLTLYTDVLNYDRKEERGFYDHGGRLIDGKTQLTSMAGDYFPQTKTALFRHSVLLVNESKDSLVTDTLHYDTRSRVAHATGPSNILSGNSRIYTEDGYYNTSDGKALLYRRPSLYNLHREMQGDSLHYDRDKSLTVAYGHIVFSDTVRKNILMGNYGWYDEERGLALCTDSALAIDYSQGDDSLYVHADTLRVETFYHRTDSSYNVLNGYFHVRAFRKDMQMICDSLSFISKDSCLHLYKDPILWSEKRQLLGEVVDVYLNDSTIDSIYIDQQALMIEQLPDTTLFNQVAGNLMRAYFQDGELTEFHVDGNGCVVDYPMERDSTFLYSNYIEAAKLRAYIQERKLQRLVGFPSPQGTTYPLGLAPPEHVRLNGFAWFEDLRPVNKDDVFIWRGKADANRLKAIPRRRAPMQTLQRLKEKAVPTTANRSTEEGNTVPESEHGGQQSEEEP